MTSREASLLKSAVSVIDEVAKDLGHGSDDNNYRLLALEAAASLVGGWNLATYLTTFEIERPANLDTLLTIGGRILDALGSSGIPVPLALAALGREKLAKHEQRQAGAYYTDWRLAQHLAESAVRRISATGWWVDPACGSGILLVAAALEAQKRGQDLDEVIGTNLAGADLSQPALRAARLAVASLTQDLAVVRAFNGRLLAQDSLCESANWLKLLPNGAAMVIGNPPWEKLKVSRHELAQSAGDDRAYGQRFEDETALVDLVSQERDQMLDYVAGVASGRKLQGSGELDLYKLFLELGIGLCATDGVLAMLVPAGLIRSQGTEPLRRELIGASAELSIDVIENRQRHFDIDSRFKFLAVVATRSTQNATTIQLRVADRDGRLPARAVSIGTSALKAVSPDLTLPEVRSKKEWNLYRRIARAGQAMNARGGPWVATFTREVDMTNDAIHFIAGTSSEGLPLVEGRHVAQFRTRAKAYQSGSGRAAKWNAVPRRESKALVTQWRIRKEDLSDTAKGNAARSRVGFCDITGQTNERSLMAARVPAGVVCGNKVPTVRFADDRPEREDLFIAVANSFVVDWMIRRRITTTINFFMLETLQLPLISPESPVGQELITLCRAVTKSEGESPSDWRIARLRARMDALVAREFNLTGDDLALIFEDFPLLDRGQPPIDGESASFVTRDLVMEVFCDLSRDDGGVWRRRVNRSRKVGAVAYVPAEYA